MTALQTAQFNAKHPHLAYPPDLQQAMAAAQAMYGSAAAAAADGTGAGGGEGGGGAEGAAGGPVMPWMGQFGS
jgi:hypothetical protein